MSNGTFDPPLMDDTVSGGYGFDTSRIQYFLPGTAPKFHCIRVSEVTDMEHCLIRYLESNAMLERSKVNMRGNPCYKCLDGRRNREDFASGALDAPKEDRYGIKRKPLAFTGAVRNKTILS